MKLHLPSGLRKALLACLAALALPASLPSTVASASGIAAVLLFAGQEARAEAVYPEFGYQTTPQATNEVTEDTDYSFTGAQGDSFTFNAQNSDLSIRLSGGSSDTRTTAAAVSFAAGDESNNFEAVYVTGMRRFNMKTSQDFSSKLDTKQLWVGGDAQLWLNGVTFGSEEEKITVELHLDETTWTHTWGETYGNQSIKNAALLLEGATLVTSGRLVLEGNAKIALTANGSLTVGEISGETYSLTLRGGGEGNTGKFSTSGGALHSLDLDTYVSLNLAGDLTLKGDSTISGTLTGDGKIILDKEGEITISSAGNNLAELVTKLNPTESVTSVTLNSSGTGDVTIETSLDLTKIKLRKESGTLTLNQGGTFGQESVLDRLEVTGGSLTLNALLYLRNGGSISSYNFGEKGRILLGNGAGLTLGGDGDVSSKIGLQDGASSATLTLTGKQNAGANFDAGINVCFDRDGETADNTGIDFKNAVTVQGDVEITEGTYVKFSGTGGALITGELSGGGALVFNEAGQTLTLGKGGSIGELQINQGSAKIGGYLSGDSLAFGAGVTLTFEEGGSFGEMRMTESGEESHIQLGGDLEVGSLADAPEGAKYSIEKAEGKTDPVHFVLGVESEEDLGFLSGVEALESEFTSSQHEGLTVGEGVGIGFATSGTIELKDGGTMHRDFKFKGLKGTGTLKFSNAEEGVQFQKHLTLEDAHIEMAGGTLTITGGLILNGQNTMDVTTATADGSPYLTLGGEDGIGDFKLRGDGTLDVNVSLSLLAEKNPGDIEFIKNWKDAWKDKISFHIVLEDGTEYSDASLDANGHLVWTVSADEFTGITYGTVETNTDGTSIEGNSVISVPGDDIAQLTFTTPGTTHLMLVAGKDGIGAGGSGKADLSELASVYFTGKNGYFVENGWFREKGPGTIYVRDTQLYFSGKEGNTADLTLTSNFVIGESLHGAADVGAAALALSKTVKTTGSLTLKEDATIAFLLNDSNDAQMSFGGKVDGSGKTLTLSEQGTGSSKTAGLELNGGGTLGKLVSEGENVHVKLGTSGTLTLEQGGTIAGTLEGDGKAGLNVAGGTLEVGTMSGSLSSLTLGAGTELSVGNGDITLGGLSWDTNTKTSLHLGATQKISLGNATLTDPTGGKKLSIDLTGSVLAAADGTEGFTIFDNSWSGLKDWDKYFRFTVDGTDASRWGYNFKVDTTTGLLTWTKSDKVVPPQIGPTPGEYGEKLGYEVGDTIRTARAVEEGDAKDIKYDVDLGATGTLNFSFNESPSQGGWKRTNLWLNVLQSSSGFTLNIAGLHADTLLVRGDNENVRTYITLKDSSASTDATDWKGLKDVYVEGNVLLDVTDSFTQEGIQTNLHLHTTDWQSTNGNDSCSLFVRSYFTTTGTIYVGYYDPTDDEESLKDNPTGARLGVLGILEVEALKGTNMQLWGSGELVLTNNTSESRLYGELQINGSSALTVQSGTFEVERAGRVGESSLRALTLAEGVSFKMNGGTLYADQISMTSNSSLQFTLQDETKDTAILELGSVGFSLDENAKASVVLCGDSGEDYYWLFGERTTAQTWWRNWYANWQEEIEFYLAAPEMAGKQVKLSYDGRIRFVSDLDELTLTWEGSEKDAVLDWELGGDVEWKKFDGSMSDWNKPEGFERDARLTGASGGSYDVNLLEDVTTGDLSVEGGATFTLGNQGGRELDVQGVLRTTLGSTLAIGKDVTVKPWYYVGDGTIQLLDGGILDMTSCATYNAVIEDGDNSEQRKEKEKKEIEEAVILKLEVDKAATEAGGTLKVGNGQTLKLDGVSGEGDLRVEGEDVTLYFMHGGTLGSLQQKDEGEVGITIADGLKLLRDSAITGVATFVQDGARIELGGDLSVGLLKGGDTGEVLSKGITIVDTRKGEIADKEDRLTLKLIGGKGRDYGEEDVESYWGGLTLGSADKKMNLEVAFSGRNNRQNIIGGEVTIWGDVALNKGILQFESNNVSIHGMVKSEGDDESTLRLVASNFTIDGEEVEGEVEAGSVKVLDFGTADGTGSVLVLGGDLEVGKVKYNSESDSNRILHRIERAADAQVETVYVLLTGRAGTAAETLQDYRNEYSENDSYPPEFTGADMRPGVGIGWAGEGALPLKGHMPNEPDEKFVTPFKLKRGILRWTDGWQTITDFTAGREAELVVEKGNLTLEQFHGELDSLTLENGVTLSIKYGTLKAQNLSMMGGTDGAATLEVNISEDKTRLSFGKIIRGSLQLQLTGWNELGDQTVGYQLFDNEDSQWKTLWKALSENWEETLIFLDDDGTEINSMVELTEDGVVRLRLEDGDLYWGATDEGSLTWSDENAWHNEEKGGGDPASFENGNRVHLEAHEGDAKDVTLGSNVIAGSMNVQGAYTLTENAATSYTLTVQKELTVGAEGALTVNKGNRLVVKDYVNIEEGGFITLATDMVVGGNIGGGGKVEKAPGADDVYVLWDNNSKGEITWKGNSWDTYVDDVLGNGVGYGKTGKTDLSIVGAASLERNFKGEQGKTVFTGGLTLNGHKLVVGEDARIIVESTDGLKVGTGKEIQLGYDGDKGRKGTIEITVKDALSNVTSEEGAELHVNLNQTPGMEDQPANTTLLGLNLDGGLVLESGEQLTFSGVNSIDNMNAEGLRDLVVVAEGSTTTLNGNVDIVNGLQLDGTITGSSEMNVLGGLKNSEGKKGNLEAHALALTYGEGETGTFAGNLKTTGDLVMTGEGSASGQTFTSSQVEVEGNLEIQGGIFRLAGGTLTVKGSVSTEDGGCLQVGYVNGVKLKFGNKLSEDIMQQGTGIVGLLELELTGFSERMLKDGGGFYQLFDPDGWDKSWVNAYTKRIHVTGWTDDDGLNPKKLDIDDQGRVVLYSPKVSGEYQAWIGAANSYVWDTVNNAWVSNMNQPSDQIQYENNSQKKTVFAGISNDWVKVTVAMNAQYPISPLGGMVVLLGKEGLGGKYFFDLSAGAACSFTIGGTDGLVIGEDTHVQFQFSQNAGIVAGTTTVEPYAKLDIVGDSTKNGSKNFGVVTIERGAEVTIKQPDNWAESGIFRGEGQLTVDLQDYDGAVNNKNFIDLFANKLFDEGGGATNQLQTFEFRNSVLQLTGNAHMASFKSLRDVVVGDNACLLFDVIPNENTWDPNANGWGIGNERNINIHLRGAGCDTEGISVSNATYNDAAFSFLTHDTYNGNDSTVRTLTSPWGFTLDDKATMRIGRDDGPAHTLKLGGTFNGNGHTLTKIGAGVLEFGFGCTVEEGSTGGIVVEDGTLKLGYVESSNGVGLKNYAVSVNGGTTLDMDNRDHLLGSLNVSSISEVLNIQGTTITINGYGDGNSAPDGFEGGSSVADNVGLAGTSWVMNWEDGTQTVKNAGSLNEVEVNAGRLVLDGVSTVKAARVNGGTLELDGGVTINTALKADGGELKANGSLTLKDGMDGMLDTLWIEGGSDDRIVLGGKGEKVLRAREVAATGEAAIQIDISGKTETQARLDFGAINGTLHLKLTGYDDPSISEYQLFVNNKQHRDLWASAVLGSDESWWKDILDIEVSGKAWSDGMELELTDDGVLHFLPFDGLTWNGDPKKGNNVWSDGSSDPWKPSGENNKPAGQHVQFTDADGGSHEGTVLVDGMVTPKKVTVRKGTYVFEQKEGTTGGLNIVQVEVKKEDGTTGIEEGSGALVIGGESGSKDANLTLALENTSIPEIQLKEHGTLVLADDGALTNEDKVRGYKKTKLRFMGGTLDYSAYEGETLTNPDVSDYVAGKNEPDGLSSTAAAKVHVSGADYAEGVTWGGREKAMTSGVGLALNGTGLELTGDGKFTLAWKEETKGSTYGDGVTVSVGEKSTLTLDVGGSQRATLADTFSGAGTLAVTGNGELKLSGDSTGMGNIDLQDGFDVEIEGNNNNALGGSGTQLTLGDGGTLSSKGDTRDNPTQVQAGTVTAAGNITVDGNITFTGKVTEEKGKEKSTSFKVAKGKTTAGFSGDISDYHGTLEAQDASSGWHMTKDAAKGEVSVGLEGNGTFDFEVQDQLTLSVPDKTKTVEGDPPTEETVKGMIAAEGGSLTLKNSGAGNLIVASGTEQSGVKLDAGENNGKITLGKDGDGAAITWEGTDLVRGNIVLANVTLAEGGFKNTGSAKIYVDTSVSPDKKSGGTVNVSGMDAKKLRGITINEHGQLTDVTGRYTVGRDARREHYGLTLHFAEENESNSGNKELIQGRDGFTLDLSKAEDDLQFAFNASIIAQLRSRDEEDKKTLRLHLLENGTITGAPDEVFLENMKDQIAQLLWSVEATIVQNEDEDSPNDWYLQLEGNTSNLYVVMDGEHSDLATVEDMVLFEGTDATAVLDGKTLTLNYDGKEKGKGDVTLHNLVGTEGTTLDLNNTGSGDDERLNVVLENTHYGDAFNNDDEKRPLTGLTEEEKSQLHGQDTTFQGKILGEAGVDITKEGKGTLTVGDDYKLDDGDTTINHGQLVLQGDENKMDGLVFNYTDERDTLAPTPGHQGEGYGNVNPEERGLVLDGGAEGSKTTIGSIVDSESNSNPDDNHIELDNAELVLTDKSELRSTTITGNEEKGGGTVTVQGSRADVTFDGGRNPRMEGVDVNVKDGGSLTLKDKAAMDVGDVTLSGKQGSSLDIGNGTTKVDSLNSDSSNSTLKSAAESGKLSVREGGSFSGKLDSSSPDSKAGTLVVEDGADFTLDNVTTTTNPAQAWDIQVGSDPDKQGGSKLTIDTSEEGKEVTFGDVKLGTGNTTTFVVDPRREASDPPALKGNSLNWGAGSTLVLKGDGAYQGDSLTLGSFSSTGENIHDLTVNLQGSAFFLKDEAKPSVKDGKLTVEFKNAEGNKFERLLPNMSKNADAGASMVWDSLKEKEPDDLMTLLTSDSDYAKMANGLIAMYDNEDKENLEKALAAVAGSSISVLGPAFVQDLHRQLNAIRNRTTTMAGEVSYETYDKLPAWHAWLNAEGNYHKMDSDGFAPGYTLNNWGGTVGADVDVSPATTVGFALTAMYGDLKPDASDAATGDLDTTYLSAFARTTKGAWIHTFVVSAGMADVSLDRTVNVGGASYRTQGSTDGYAVGAMYEVGYTKLVNRKGTIALQPVFNVEIRHAAIKGYTETGSDAGLKVDDIEQDVVTFGIGARMQSIVGENFYNRTSILEARLLLKADVGDSTGVSSNSLTGSAAVGEVESAEIGAFGVEAGVGLTIPLGSSRGSVFMDASAEVRSGWTSFNATVGYRISF